MNDQNNNLRQEEGWTKSHSMYVSLLYLWLPAMIQTYGFSLTRRQTIIWDNDKPVKCCSNMSDIARPQRRCEQVKSCRHWRERHIFLTFHYSMGAYTSQHTYAVMRVVFNITCKHWMILNVFKNGNIPVIAVTCRHRLQPTWLTHLMPHICVSESGQRRFR